MTDLERRGLNALCNCSMRIASNGKRFRNDIARAAELDPELKLTAAQALLLWDLVYTYRRQINDPQLVQYGEHARSTKTLPDIYRPGDHREPVRKAKKRPVEKPQKKTRLEEELERGKGRLAI